MNQKEIFELIDKFEKSRLTVLKVESEGFAITLKNESSPAAQQPALTYPVTGGVAAPPPEEQSAETDVEVITSPVVGTFYRSPAPDAPVFVEEGSVVAAGDSICIIEAMKIMNKLEAEYPCQIIKILAENGQMVEYGAPLFEVRRN